MKRCTTCKVEKRESEFNKHIRCKNGLNPVCRACKKIADTQYREENREKLREQYKAIGESRRNDNVYKARAKEWIKRWQKENKDRFYEINKAYKNRNPQIVASIDKRRRAKLPDYYIKHLLKESNIPISEETIEIYREVVKIKRAIKTNQHG